MESLTIPKKLSICAHRNEKQIELIFENNGPEIEKKVLNQIFDKFLAGLRGIKKFKSI